MKNYWAPNYPDITDNPAGSRTRQHAAKSQGIID